MRTAALTEVRPPMRPVVLIDELVVVPCRCAVWKHQERTLQDGTLVEGRSQLRKHAVVSMDLVAVPFGSSRLQNATDALGMSW